MPVDPSAGRLVSAGRPVPAGGPAACGTSAGTSGARGTSGRTSASGGTSGARGVSRARASGACWTSGQTLAPSGLGCSAASGRPDRPPRCLHTARAGRGTADSDVPPRVVALGLSQDAEPMVTAGHAVVVPDAGEDLQRMPVALLGLPVVALDLGDLADLLDPGRAQRRPRGKPGERLPDERGLAVKLAPGMQLRAHDLGESSGLVVVARHMQVVAALQQVVQVRLPVLRPGGRLPLPVFGGPLVRPGDLVARARPPPGPGAACPRPAGRRTPAACPRAAERARRGSGHEQQAAYPRMRRSAQRGRPERGTAGPGHPRRAPARRPGPPRRSGRAARYGPACGRRRRRSAAAARER